MKVTLIPSQELCALNVVEIVSDTFRRDYLGCYGNEWIHTKYLDSFGKDSLIFDRAYIASFPTMPHRADIFTGKWTFNYLGWAPLPREETLLAEILQREGYVTKAVVDTPFFVRDDYNYNRGFWDFEWIRGQGRERRDVNLQRRYETDYCAPATMLAASRWLERHYKEKFFLYVDTWDPHEPWDPPRWYAEMYGPEWKGDELFPLKSQRAVDYTEVELNRLRALYAGEVTMVDRWVGTLLQKVEDLGLLEDTAVIFTTDHGSYHGEHGYVTKVAYKSHLYEEVARIPLVIRVPDSEGAVRGHCNTLVQSPDLMPTILDFVGVQIPEIVQARSLLPIIRGEESQIREFAVSSGGFPSPLHHRLTVTSKEWSLLAVRADAPKTMMRRAKEEQVQPSELYHLPTDPKQTQNLYNERKEVVEELHSKMIEFLELIGTKQEILEKWKTLR